MEVLSCNRNHRSPAIAELVSVVDKERMTILGECQIPTNEDLPCAIA